MGPVITQGCRDLGRDLDLDPQAQFGAPAAQKKFLSEDATTVKTTAQTVGGEADTGAHHNISFLLCHFLLVSSVGVIQPDTRAQLILPVELSYFKHGSG